MEGKVIVVDGIMGSGKSTWAIDSITIWKRGQRFIFVTPYLDEVDRVIQACNEREVKVQTPNAQFGEGSKSVHLKKILERGESIVTTHSLFDKMDEECIELIKSKGYVLYMDEVHEVLSKLYITENDYTILKDAYISIDKESGRVIWTKENYKGKFEDFRNLCNLGAVYRYNETLYVWCFPAEIFRAMREVYIMTYFFEGQIQSAYYKMHNIEYEKKQIVQNGRFYDLIDYTEEKVYQDIKDRVGKIKLYEGNLNYDKTVSLSTRYFKSSTNESFVEIKNNTLNYFQNIVKGKSDENMWTTLKDYKNKLKGQGYTKGFVPLNARATNKYSHKKNLAYLYNRYLNPIDKNFFVKQGIIVDEDKYALSELLQWLFRSSIRKDGNINLYLPAKRMRELYLKWSRGEM